VLRQLYYDTQALCDNRSREVKCAVSEEDEEEEDEEEDEEEE